MLSLMFAGHKWRIPRGDGLLVRRPETHRKLVGSSMLYTLPTGRSCRNSKVLVNRNAKIKIANKLQKLTCPTVYIELTSTKVATAKGAAAPADDRKLQLDAKKFLNAQFHSAAEWRRQQQKWSE
ncbi:unnamed protein product [Ceratitis capitata]|uniref:(Mediterranean fruit fly) hypothetical protein n=1 Tax=Ceratitis capitata TaxID=7213 RepID=A0A811VGJ2_CERCA|nr:unnamed protein product [Ceratitis capitata]